MKSYRTQNGTTYAAPDAAGLIDQMREAAHDGHRTRDEYMRLAADRARLDQIELDTRTPEAFLDSMVQHGYIEILTDSPCVSV